jgi:hypothetical protein
LESIAVLGLIKYNNFIKLKMGFLKNYFFKLIFNHKKPKVPETNEATKMAILE